MGIKKICLYLLSSVLSICVCAYAETPTPEKALNEYNENKIPAAENTISKLSGEYKTKALTMINDTKSEDFWTNFGVGLIVNKDLGSNKPPEKAKVVNGIVRVEEENDVKYGMGLEVHKFMWGWTFNNKRIADFSSSIAIGPYVGILPGAQEVFDVIGAGVMFGFFGSSKPDDKKTGRWSMNIGVGGYMDPDTKVLASGFKDGQPVPNGETEVQLKKETQYGLQGMLSFSTTF